ncbi:MAG: hypothetical protein EP335_15920 [Alphaproteobacteria bacterium]|nr:MAG: hypothetical protein EP335_15920 [Alphaproteobacteria bacterium]
MSGAHEDIEDTGGSPQPVRDDFSSDPHDDTGERRLHLKAFDYWLALRADRTLPLFQDLSPGGLAPYRSNALLLEFAGTGAVVRFIGDRVSILIDAPIVAGTNLSDFPRSPFAQAILEQLSDEPGRAEAAEFEFVEDVLECRGIMLPFSRDGDHAHFVMVVTNFRRREGVDHGAGFVLEDLRSASVRAARDVVHLDGGSRDSLYEALARAFALYDEGRKNPDAWAIMLRDAGLKAQARAPFTPALKLTFGKDYDKTRLTEYAAALACAERAGLGAEDLVAFLKDQPGGIKGCVLEERRVRRGQGGTPAADKRRALMESARKRKAVKLNTLKTEEEFCLLVGRRNKDGGIDLLGKADAGDSTTEKMLGLLTTD